jgi:hypothetical protein
MIRKSDPAWPWMAGAFGGALLLATIVLAIEGTGPDSLKLGLRVTARWSFLFFWLSYVGGAMASLFGPTFAGLARRGRQLGLAFAAAHLIHVGLIVWLGIVTGQVPLQGGLLWFFLIALFFAYLLMLLSFGAGPRILGRLWRPLLFVGTSYILIAFGRDFVLDALNGDIRNWHFDLEYVSFAALTLAAIVLRFAVFLQRHFPLRSAAA